MLKLFASRRKKAPPLREIAAQLTPYQRASFEHASVPPGGFPYSAYAQMEQDSMIQTALSVKKQGILAPGFRIVPASDSAAARSNVEFVEEQFVRMDGSPHTILLGAMDAFAKGWSVQELVWSEREGRLWLEAVKPKDPSSLGVDLDTFGNVESLRLELPGEPPSRLSPEKFVLYFNRRSYGRPKGCSDLDAAHRHWVAKSNLLSAWRLHLERFATPTVVGKFPVGTPLEDQSMLLAVLSDLQNRTAMVVSQDHDIESIGGQRETSTGFIDAIDFHNREIARSILGQTLTTDEGRRVGSLALGKVHLQVLLLQLEGLRKELADVVMTEQVIRPMVEYNFGPGEIPRFEFEPVMLSAFSTGELN